MRRLSRNESARQSALILAPVEESGFSGGSQLVTSTAEGVICMHVLRMTVVPDEGARFEEISDDDHHHISIPSWSRNPGRAAFRAGARPHARSIAVYRRTAAEFPCQALGVAGRASRAAKAPRRRRTTGFPEGHRRDPRVRVDRRVNSRRFAGPTGGNYGSCGPKDDYQRAEFGCERVHGGL